MQLTIIHRDERVLSVRRVPVRRPLVERKRVQRREARMLIARRTRRPPLAAQLAFDPLARPSQRAGRRRARLGLALFASLAFHGATVALGLAVGGRVLGPLREEVKIELHQRPPAPLPPKMEPPPVENPTQAPPKVKVAKTPPPPAVAPPKVAPVRVVGLSLESAGDGGDGPAFAVGNTRMGETAKTAAPPQVALPPPFVSGPGPAPSPARSNQVATRLPIAGVKYEKPKPRRTPEPEYPAALKGQGIEADVMVLASIDVDGKVSSVAIIKEAPYPAFNEAARAAVLRYEYEPATRDGVPTPYQLSFTLRFRLKDDE